MSRAAYNFFCPAKVNLFLEVTSRRADGYHELATLFAKLKFGDNISLSLTPAPQSEIDLKITGPYAGVISADADNLVYKAAAQFFEFTGITAKCSIVLEKNIPTGAGLGGGSSDAGTLLRALCDHYKVDFKTLLPLAAKLGADVPLFLYKEGVMKGTGIGDVLTPVKLRGSLPYAVLSYPDVHVATPNVFKGLTLPCAEQILTSALNLDKIIFALTEGSQFSLWKDFLFNRLEDTVLPKVKEVSQLKKLMQALGAQAVLMSGSGSTVFALFDTEQEATKFAERLKERGSVSVITQLWEGL